MLKVGTSAQHTGQEPEIETGISVIFSTQVNPVLFCVTGGIWSIAVTFYHFARENEGKARLYIMRKPTIRGS